MKYKHISVLFFACILFLSVVYAVPQPPHYFYGSVTIGGANAPSGSTITAKIGGVTKGTLTTTAAGTYGGAAANQDKLTVTGCEVGDACYSATQTISFTISASGCSGTDAITSAFTSGSVESKTLGFGGSCPGTSTGSGSTSGGGSSSSSGGGGSSSGGGGGPTAKPKFFDLPAIGGIITMRLNDHARITIIGEDHEFTLDEITRDYIIGTWSPGGKTIQIRLGETVATDLDGDGSNDVSIRLISISGTLKEATFEFLPLAQKEAVQPETKQPEPQPGAAPVTPPVKKPLTGMIIIAVIVLVGLIGYYIYYKSSSKEY